MVKLLFYKGRGNCFDKLIRLFTNSKYSHVEIYDGMYCYSSSPRDGGVRRKIIDINPNNWDVVTVPWVNPDRIDDLFTKTVGKKYDWLGIVHIVLPFIPHAKTRWFCSEWVGTILKVCKPEDCTPQDLYEVFHEASLL